MFYFLKILVLFLQLGTFESVITQVLLGFIDGNSTDITGIAGGHFVLALQVSSHVVLFVRDMS